MARTRQQDSGAVFSSSDVELANTFEKFPPKSREQLLHIYQQKMEVQKTITRWVFGVASILGAFALSISLLLGLRGDPFPCAGVATAVMAMVIVVVATMVGRVPEKAMLRAIRPIQQ
ncbi:hypothetical protein QCN29_09865 [Streptomyces sp. HNM0663]|uniref:Uncharacterized protein n=1 Tax=Streptomyces chengmaiensis TaxID=3040919 RepID=A0ABT6HK26_9ACTN|nr:hypothetical protein [Streptomyces chengmaiensis]MDH2389092.1 hypothetical protein [Streptomyces chengmaiensis]